MAQPPSMGVLAHFGTNGDTTSTPAAATTEYEWLHESIGSDREIVRTEGLRGTRLHPAERVRLGRQTPGGVVTMQPTYIELATLLPYMIGAASTSGGQSTYTVSDTVPVAFQTVVDRVAKVMTTYGCRTDQVTLRCGKGRPLEIDWAFEGLGESIGNAGTFASLTISNTPPFVWTDATLTLAGSAVEVEEFSCTIGWHLKKDRFVNSITRTDLPSMDFTCHTRFQVPYTSDTTGLYDGGGGVSGVSGNINFIYGGAGGGSTGVNLKLAFANIIFPAKKSPQVQGRDEIMLVLEGESRRASTTSPLIVTLDSTIA